MLTYIFVFYKFYFIYFFDFLLFLLNWYIHYIPQINIGYKKIYIYVWQIKNQLTYTWV